VKRSSGLATIALCAACRSAGPFNPARASDYARTLEAPLVASMHQAGSCGTESRLGSALSVVAFSVERCLGCEEVGFVLRSLARDAARHMSHLVVVVPDSGMTAICPFLGKERLLRQATVLGIQGLPWVVGPETDGYLSYTRDSVGSIAKQRFVRRAIELLKDTVADR